MKRQVGNRVAKLLGAVGAIIVFGQVRKAEVERRDQAGVVRMTRKIKTPCIGRFLIDLPDETRVELSGPRIDGLDISSFDEPDADFQVRLAQRVSNLRAAPRTIGGVTGDEVVTRVAEMNDTVGYSFCRKVAGTADNVFVPHFVLQMSTGEGSDGPVPTSLSQDAAMALWGKLSSSIRFHQAGGRKGVRPTLPASASTKASRAPQV